MTRTLQALLSYYLTLIFLAMVVTFSLYAVPFLDVQYRTSPIYVL